MKEASVFLYGNEEIYFAEDFDLIINSDEFSFSEDKNNLRYRLVCSACGSPVTYVKKKDGQKYFMHPKRSNQTLKEKDANCIKRVKSISRSSIKTYNQIVEQTTLNEYADNFKRIVNNLITPKSTEDQFQMFVQDAKNIALKPFFEFYEKGRELNLHLFQKKHDPKRYNEALNLLELNNEEIFNFFYNELIERYKNKYDWPSVGEIACIKNPEVIILYTLAGRQYNFDNKLTSDWDEYYKQAYRLEIRKEFKEFPILMKMIMHRNSHEIKNWIIFHYLQSHYATHIQNGRDYKYISNSTAYDQLKFHQGELFYLIAQGRTKSTWQGDDWEKRYNFSIKRRDKICMDKINLYPMFISLVISDIICGSVKNKSRLEEWYKSLSSINKQHIENKNLKSGFIYVAVNNDVYRDGKGFDDRTKIGETKLPAKRRDDFLFLGWWRVKDRKLAEKFIHKALGKYQLDKGSGREFFVLPVEEAKKKVKTLINEFNDKYGYFQDELVERPGKGFG